MAGKVCSGSSTVKSELFLIYLLGVSGKMILLIKRIHWWDLALKPVSCLQCGKEQSLSACYHINHSSDSKIEQELVWDSGIIARRTLVLYDLIDTIFS